MLGKNFILDILFPPLCLGCKKYLEKRDEFCCNDCLSLVKINNTLFCPVCQARLAENKRVCNHGAEAQKNFPYLLAAAMNYDDKITRELIQFFKYKNLERLSCLISEFILKYLKTLELDLENFVVVPVPLHPFKERRRGFNQSKILAQAISKECGLELDCCIVRIKNTKPQAQAKNRQNRNQNLANAFKMAEAEKISGKNILLVDDVYTSGATMNEAAKILKESGAKKIIALVAAKA